VFQSTNMLSLLSSGLGSGLRLGLPIPSSTLVASLMMAAAPARGVCTHRTYGDRAAKVRVWVRVRANIMVSVELKVRVWVRDRVRVMVRVSVKFKVPYPNPNLGSEGPRLMVVYPQRSVGIASSLQLLRGSV
jgi:hypothetical protein